MHASGWQPDQSCGERSVFGIGGKDKQAGRLYKERQAGNGNVEIPEGKCASLPLVFLTHTHTHARAQGKHMRVFCNHGTSFLEVCCGFVLEMGRIHSSRASENTPQIKAPATFLSSELSIVDRLTDIFQMFEDSIL